MPHKNRQDRSAQQQRRRAAGRGLPPPTPPGEAPPGEAPDEPVPPVPVRTAADVLAVLEATVNDVRAGGNPMTARTLTYVLSVALRAVELATIEGRLEAVERALKLRSENP